MRGGLYSNKAKGNAEILPTFPHIEGKPNSLK